MAKKSTTTVIMVILAVVTTLAVGYIILGGEQAPAQPRATCPTGYYLNGNLCQQLPSGAATPAQPGSPVAPGTIVAVSAPDTNDHTGTLNFALKSSTDGTGTISKLLFLKDSEGRDAQGRRITDAGAGAFDERTTRYYIMDTLINTGNSGLKAYDGSSPQDISPSSGTWAVTQLNTRAGTNYIAFTYKDTTAGKAENGTTAKRISINTWQTGDSTWSAKIADGGSAWNLYNYPYFDWMDSGNNPKLGIDFGNGGTAGNTQTIRWYGNVSTAGEKLFDTAVFVNAPSNFTGKYKSLTVTPKTGNGVQFTNSLLKADGVAELSGTVGLIPAATLNYNTYFVGFLPDSMDTLRTSSDRKEMQFTLSTTTYSTQMNVTFYLMQNAHARTQTDAFLAVNPFEVGMSTGSNNAFW